MLSDEQRMIATIREAEARRAREAFADATFAKVAEWMHYLGVSRRQVIVLAQVYSFSGDGKEFYMSLGRAGKLLRIDRDNIKHDLSLLVDKGFLIKRVNGPRKPASYLVNDVACYKAAVENGWIPPRKRDKGRI